ncbi:MAG: YhbY family RNA-binding protein [Burkholderiales bacterium]|jgi:putative YhbY family RNA-binding protein|nr:YhbY family RNA-binding protein [Burkholderiales bacterium]
MLLTLTPTERRALRAQAHALDPVVMIGQHGLTSAVLREIDRALNAHELIKVRIFNDDRAEREALQLTICDQLACAPVQHVGKLIILWRPAPPKAEAAPKPVKRPAKKTAKTMKPALPGAINRHGLAVKPLSARQARQLDDPDKMPFADTRPPRPVGRGSRTAGGKLPLQQTKAKPPRNISGQQPVAAQRPVGRRRLGARGKA